MYIKIYFNDKPLFLCDEVDEIIQPYVHQDDAVFIDELNSHTVKSMIHEIAQPEIHAGVFYHAGLEELKKAFFKKFTFIQAAGGLVFNEKKQILIIFRRGKWDLPKGKLDKGESIEACAVREVEEECGIHDTRLLGPLTTTYHVYDEFGKHILKESHWFRMHSPGEQALVPQLAEQITAIEWTDATRRAELLKSSYPLVASLLQE
jgi:8-oxo-dGTP pyrophosphatase MutT (NUDIX family)